MYFFPEIFPDELLWSAWGRYAEQVDYSNITTLHVDLFGYPRRGVARDLPNGLDAFVARLPPGHSYRAEQLALHNTMFPYYRLGMPVARADALLKAMRRDDAKRARHEGQPHALVPKALLPSTLGVFRLCPSCAEEDSARPAGSPYWHRVHQLPGVYVCPEHGTPLLTSNVTRGRATRRRDAYRLPDARVLESSVPLRCPQAPPEALLTLAQASKWVLAAGPESAAYETAVAGLRRAAILRGVAGAVARKGAGEAAVDAVGLARLTRDRCGDALLEAVGCPVRAGTPQQYWTTHLLRAPSRMRRRPGRGTHPLRILLAACALDVGPAELEQLAAMTTEAFACMGGADTRAERVAQHRRRYHALRSATLGPGTVRRSGQRLGPVRDDWSEALRQLCADPALSLEDVASVLGVGTGTVLRRAGALGCLRATWGTHPGAIQTPHDADPTAPEARRCRRQHLTPEQQAEVGRAALIAALNADPMISRSDLIRRHRRAYSMVRAHDPQWFEQHVPTRRPYRSAGSRAVDWAARDAEYSAALARTLAAEDDAHGPRRTKSYLMRQARLPYNHFAKFGHLLPGTTDVLTRGVECRATFARRRIETAALALRREFGARVTKSSVLARAGFGGGCHVRGSELMTFARELAGSLADPQF